MNPLNYQKELEKVLQKIDTENGSGKEKPSLFLHSCCAPCSSYVLEYLRSYFAITVFYYNPNISREQEYIKRVEEQKRLIAAYNEKMPEHEILVVEGDYHPDLFYQTVKGLEQCPEGGERCERCFELRLRRTAQMAKQGGFDYFGTTLTISPLKNAAKLNEIGQALQEEYDIPWLPSDFKKKNGYKRSIELSREYELYRQDFCGCAFSQAERQKQQPHTFLLQ